MSQTLGEKLRQAREERGISVAEVAEQTRISPHYIESIERDDYKPLPGGIFNKGFVKSFAKYVNIDEQQALADYTSLISSSQPVEEPEMRTYRPEVLTDDNSGRSMVPTVIMAVIILALMTAGILFGLNYLQNRSSSETSNTAANTNTSSVPASNANTSSPASTVPDMANVKVDFKAVGAEVSLYAIADAAKPTTRLVKIGETVSFDPKESLKLSYSKSLASAVQLTLNGKQITPPVQSQAKRNVIEIEINRNNLGEIWQTGSIGTGVPPPITGEATPVSSTPVVRAPVVPKPLTTPAANTTVGNTAKPVVKPTAAPKPAAPTAANKPRPE